MQGLIIEAGKVAISEGAKKYSKMRKKAEEEKAREREESLREAQAQATAPAPPLVHYVQHPVTRVPPSSSILHACTTSTSSTYPCCPIS